MGGVVHATRLPSPGDSTVEQLVEFADPRAIPDGLAVAGDGSFYVAVLFAPGLCTYGLDGSDRGRLDVGAVPSNCTFSGNALYVTDGGSELRTTGSLAPLGALWRAELDVPGLELFRGRSGQKARAVMARLRTPSLQNMKTPRLVTEPSCASLTTSACHSTTTKPNATSA